MRVPRISRLALIAASVIVVAIIAFPVGFTLTENTELSLEQAKAAVVGLRSSLKPDGRFVLPDVLEEVAGDEVPVVFTLWAKGKRKRVYQSSGEPLENALETFAQKLKRVAHRYESSRMRLGLDFVIAEGWIPEEGVLGALAFVEGRHGISGEVDGTRIYLPPSELIRNRRYGSFKPLPDMDSRFKVGLNLEKVTSTILHQGKRVGVEGEAPEDLRRFESLTVVEGEDLVPRRLFKGTVERPAVDRGRVRAAVLAGARYLVSMLGSDGVFRYYYNPVKDRDEKGDYNWPRHAGVTYSLALVGRLLGVPSFVAAASRALTRFEEQLSEGPDGSRCLESRDKCYLGSSALGLLALAEYRIASKDPRFDGVAGEVASFLKAMQREDGFFYHDWYPGSGIDVELMKLYASQQAVFALARHAAATGDADSLARAERGMDYLAGPYWDHFLGSYFFGQEHWTCLAAEEVYNAHPKREYAELCHGIGVHYDNITHGAGETPFEEDEGGMSVTHLFTPHLGGTATAAEAMVSAALLGDAIGAPTGSIKEQLGHTYGFLIRGQVTAHDAFWMPSPALAVGGFFETQTTPKIRIDNVQHAISAMVRGLEFIEKGNGASQAAAEKDYLLTE